MRRVHTLFRAWFAELKKTAVERYGFADTAAAAFDESGVASENGS
jgi:hypothetical protein